MSIDLDRVRDLAARESGLAVVITYRLDGSAHASVVNAGVVTHPVTGDAVIGFVVRGSAKKLVHLRTRPQATVVVRSAWEWVAVEGTVELAGPDDPLDGVAERDVLWLLRTVYAAAVGGTADDWIPLEGSMADERHAAALLRPTRVTSNPT